MFGKRRKWRGKKRRKGNRVPFKCRFGSLNTVKHTGLKNIYVNKENKKHFFIQQITQRSYRVIYIPESMKVLSDTGKICKSCRTSCSENCKTHILLKKKFGPLGKGQLQLLYKFDNVFNDTDSNSKSKTLPNSFFSRIPNYNTQSQPIRTTPLPTLPSLDSFLSPKERKTTNLKSSMEIKELPLLSLFEPTLPKLNDDDDNNDDYLEDDDFDLKYPSSSEVPALVDRQDEDEDEDELDVKLLIPPTFTPPEIEFQPYSPIAPVHIHKGKRTNKHSSIQMSDTKNKIIPSHLDCQLDLLKHFLNNNTCNATCNSGCTCAFPLKVLGAFVAKDMVTYIYFECINPDHSHTFIHCNSKNVTNGSYYIPRRLSAGVMISGAHQSHVRKYFQISFDIPFLPQQKHTDYNKHQANLMDEMRNLEREKLYDKLNNHINSTGLKCNLANDSHFSRPQKAKGVANYGMNITQECTFLNNQILQEEIVCRKDIRDENGNITNFDPINKKPILSIGKVAEVNNLTTVRDKIVNDGVENIFSDENSTTKRLTTKVFNKNGKHSAKFKADHFHAIGPNKIDPQFNPLKTIRANNPMIEEEIDVFDNSEEKTCPKCENKTLGSRKRLCGTCKFKFPPIKKIVQKKQFKRGEVPLKYPNIANSKMNWQLFRDFFKNCYKRSMAEAKDQAYCAELYRNGIIQHLEKQQKVSYENNETQLILAIVEQYILSKIDVLYHELGGTSHVESYNSYWLQFFQKGRNISDTNFLARYHIAIMSWNLMKRCQTYNMKKEDIEKVKLQFFRSIIAHNLNEPYLLPTPHTVRKRKRNDKNSSNKKQKLSNGQYQSINKPINETITITTASDATAILQMLMNNNPDVNEKDES